MRQFTLVRDQRTHQCTYGVWSEDGTVRFQTLEPLAPMPRGTYTWRLRYSPSHHYAVYGALQVPGHSNIECHPGNTYHDTEDCVLPGDTRGGLVVAGERCDAVLHSRDTFAAFMANMGVPNYKDLNDWDKVRAFIQEYPQYAEFTCTITDPPGEAA